MTIWYSSIVKSYGRQTIAVEPVCFHVTALTWGDRKSRCAVHTRPIVWVKNTACVVYMKLVRQCSLVCVPELRAQVCLRLAGAGAHSFNGHGAVDSVLDDCGHDSYVSICLVRYDQSGPILVRTFWNSCFDFDQTTFH